MNSKAFLRSNVPSVVLIAATLALTLTLVQGKRATPITAETGPALAVGIESRPPMPDAGREVLARIISFPDTKGRIKLAEALQIVADSGHFKLHIKQMALETAGIQPDGLISLDQPLHEVSVRRAMNAIVDAVPPDQPLGYEYVDDAMVVSTYDELCKHTITVVYNIRDIIDAYAQYEAGHSRAPAREEGLDRLTRILTETVAPDTWRDAGGSVGAMREMMGLLIVTQTPNNQRLVSDLLTTFRQSSRSIPPSEVQFGVQ